MSTLKLCRFARVTCEHHGLMNVSVEPTAEINACPMCGSTEVNIGMRGVGATKEQLPYHLVLAKPNEKIREDFTFSMNAFQRKRRQAKVNNEQSKKDLVAGRDAALQQPVAVRQLQVRDNRERRGGE